MPLRSATFLLLLLPTVLPAAAPPPLSPTAHGDRLLCDYFRLQSRQIGDSALGNVRTKADWERLRPQLRRQFLDMMGLWPLPKHQPARHHHRQGRHPSLHGINLALPIAARPLRQRQSLSAQIDRQALSGHPLRVWSRAERHRQGVLRQQGDVSASSRLVRRARLRLPDRRYPATRRVAGAASRHLALQYVVVAIAGLHTRWSRVLERHARPGLSRIAQGGRCQPNRRHRPIRRRGDLVVGGGGGRSGCGLHPRGGHRRPASTSRKAIPGDSAMESSPATATACTSSTPTAGTSLR